MFEGEQISQEVVLELMRASYAADSVARNGRWEDALTLLQRATGRAFASPGTDPWMPHGDPLDPPEVRYQRARASIAAHVRAWLDRAPKRRLRSLEVLERRVLIGLVLLLLLAMAGPAWRTIRDRDLTLDASWKASSTGAGPIDGVFPRRRIYQTLPAYFFHTQLEPAPHLDIDLRSVHAVDRIVVVNRYDCCYERARGLRVLSSLDGEHYFTVAQRDGVSFFRRWDVTFKPQAARYVRLQLPASPEILHLSDVRVYGR